MRLDAKHNKLNDNELKELQLTNADVKLGLKLPLNAYSGALRAKFNKLYDPLQGFSICITGQLLLLQLISDLRKIPTLDMVSANTDAVMFYIDDSYKDNALAVIKEWEDLTGLELEEDKIVKIIMRDVNNYCEIVQKGDGYEVNYKGGSFTGKHKFKWDKEQKKFKYHFEDDLVSNSLTITSEALLKKLLFDIPVETTINKCNDIFRFQMISHVGSTYEYMAREVNGEYERLPQKTNRIYAGKESCGLLYKVKKNKDGTLRYDQLASCPTNPIIDNDNKCTIDKINKEWYIEYTKQKVEDFLGTGKCILKGRKKNMKKDELIQENERLSDENKKLQARVEELENGLSVLETPAKEEPVFSYPKLLHKINEFRKLIRERKFILDKAMDNRLGGEEYHSIGQYYNAVQELCLQVGLDFRFEAIDEVRFERDIFKSSTGANKHLATVRCMATLTDIDTGCEKRYMIIASGSDSIDKSISGAETLAFRKWFTFNFTPDIKFDWEKEDSINDEEQSNEPKIPTYLPPEKKEEVKIKVVTNEQHEESDKEDVDFIIDSIYLVRENTENKTYGSQVLEFLQKGNPTSADILAYKLKIQNKLQELGLNNG